MVVPYSDISSGREILKVSNLVAGYRRDLPIVIDVSIEVYEFEISFWLLILVFLLSDE